MNIRQATKFERIAMSVHPGNAISAWIIKVVGTSRNKHNVI